MSMFWAAFLNLLVRTAPCHLLAYYPYRKQMRFAPWKIYLTVGIFQTVQAVFYGMAAADGNPTYVQEYYFSIVYMPLYFFFVRADRPKLLFLYVFVMDYSMIVRGFAVFLETRLFYGGGDMVFYSLRSTLLLTAAFAVTLPFMMRFFRQAHDQVFGVEAPLFWQTAWIVPALTSAIVLIFTGNFSAGQAYTWTFFLARFLLLLCILVMYSILLNSLDTVRRQAALAEQAAIQEHLLSVQKTHYEQLRQYIQEMRAARHDLRQHLGVIRAYLNSGDEDALLEYLNAYTKTLPADTPETFCANFAVNAILCYYADKARKNGIAFCASLGMPEDLPCNEAELCSLLGNLLENAVDACQESRGDSPWINVRGICEQNRIVLTVDNTCPHKPREENGRFLSSKHEGYGIGTYSVSAIAGRNGGTAEFSYEDGVFYASVLLYGDGR